MSGSGGSIIDNRPTKSVRLILGLNFDFMSGHKLTDKGEDYCLTLCLSTHKPCDYVYSVTEHHIGHTSLYNCHSLFISFIVFVSIITILLYRQSTNGGDFKGNFYLWWWIQYNNTKQNKNNLVGNKTQNNLK